MNLTRTTLLYCSLELEAETKSIRKASDRGRLRIEKLEALLEKNQQLDRQFKRLQEAKATDVSATQ